LQNSLRAVTSAVVWYDGGCFALRRMMVNGELLALSTQLVWLLVLAAPVACVAWTVTHEEIFAEFHALCVKRSRTSRGLFTRKFFYVFTCEYCFSHYVAAAAIAVTGFRLLAPGWTGLVIAWLAAVWIANVYMSLFVRLRLDIKRERVELTVEEQKAADMRSEDGRSSGPYALTNTVHNPPPAVMPRSQQRSGR
jgi:hypothetical protein